MDELNEIENALLRISQNTNFPMAESWFHEYWKPRFEKIRSLMISPELKKAMYDIVSEMMECDPWHAPFDELQKPK
jgi:hypothetical protein